MFKHLLQNIKMLTLSILCFLSATAFATNVCIIIPAYNEEKRIEHTLVSYEQYFQTKPEKTTFLVVANNCSDNTVPVVQKLQKTYPNIDLLNLKPGGKGFAVKEGFLWAQNKDFDLIGFVDADMATKPEYFYDLIVACKDADGAIASRYAKGAQIVPSRHWLRKLGGKFYNWLLRTKLNLPFKDTQCGAKIFTKDTIQKVSKFMTEIGWSFDLELLYLCKLEGKVIKEIPTTWTDQPGTHLQITSKIMKEFLNAPTRIKKRHVQHKQDMQKKRAAQKKALRKKIIQ